MNDTRQMVRWPMHLWRFVCEAAEKDCRPPSEFIRLGALERAERILGRSRPSKPSNEPNPPAASE